MDSQICFSHKIGNSDPDNHYSHIPLTIQSLRVSHEPGTTGITRDATVNGILAPPMEGLLKNSCPGLRPSLTNFLSTSWMDYNFSHVFPVKWLLFHFPSRFCSVTLATCLAVFTPTMRSFSQSVYSILHWMPTVSWDLANHIAMYLNKSHDFWAEGA